MDKAVKAHPKYNQLMMLAQQANTISAQLEARHVRSADTNQKIETINGLSLTAVEELNKAFEQEFNAKMTSKQDVLSSRISGKADAVHRILSEELNAYNEQLEKEYQPQIFNVQLKLKTVQLGKDEAAALQAELEKLQKQRAEAMAAKQAQLAARMDEQVAGEKTAVEQELAAYAQELNADLSKQLAAKQAEIALRGNNQSTTATPSDQLAIDLSQQLELKKQEISALQGFIIQNITDKTAKVATEGGFEAIITNVAVNVSAVDITTLVITECNK